MPRHSPLPIHRFTNYLFLFGLLLFITNAQSADVQDELPPIRTEVTYKKGERGADDPEGAWDEWDETDANRHNSFPRRQREIKEGMNVNTILGMAMKQPKVVTAVLTPEYGSSENIGQQVTRRYRDQLAAAGIGCRLWFVREKGRQVVANCETIRDGHMAKDYFIRQPEIMRTVLDNVPFTPRPQYADDDDDDDDDDDSSSGKASETKTEL